MSVLLAEPHWARAAQALVDGCVDLPLDEDRVALLSRVCDGLGDELYPALLRLLWVVGERGDHAACAAVAGALVHALRTGRLPSGRCGAWGAAAREDFGRAYGPLRSLGPIEYLCVWHAQADADHALAAAHFHVAARAVMGLVAANPDARLLYCEKLLADVDDPLAGALTRHTRAALRALATAWGGGASPDDASACFLAALTTAPARLPPALRAPPAGPFHVA
ncbi:MAG: hypothetical protein ABIX12_10325 [Rubrivivax sp.]